LPRGTRVTRSTRDALILLVAGSLGPIVFVALNLRIHGTPLGPYVQLVREIGFLPSILPEKLTSLFLDSAALHLEPHAAILERFPWIFLAVIGIPLVWLKGSSVARVLGVSIVLQFLFYACYVDLLPHGLWRYKNIHYFAWAYPYLALFATVAVIELWERRRPARIAAIAAVVVPLLSIGFLREEVPVSVGVREGAAGEHILNMGFKSPRRLNVIDLSGWSGTYHDVFQTHTVRVIVDGTELRSTGEVKPLLAGFGIRILFIRPVRASRIELVLAPAIRVDREGQRISAARYRLAPGIARWPWRWFKGLGQPTPWL
jgi:hypothetical protein